MTQLLTLNELSKIFKGASGTRTIEVAKSEYEGLLKEAKKENVPIELNDKGFKLKTGDVTVQILQD